MFEKRRGRAFHFNSGKLGKFIECEFDQPVRICKSRLVSEPTSNPQSDATFVIQGSKNRDKWITMIAFRHKRPVMDIKFKNCKQLKFWRYVLVDHETKGESCFRGIGWFIKH